MSHSYDPCTHVAPSTGVIILCLICSTQNETFMKSVIPILYIYIMYIHAVYDDVKTIGGGVSTLMDCV